MSFYLVTGGAGFIGSHLAETLIASGHRVRILDNLSTGQIQNIPKKAELLIGDVTNPATVEAALTNIEGVFHLAAVASVEKSTSDWLSAHKTNVGGTVTVIDSVHRSRPGGACPVIYASSAAVYGSIASDAISENVGTRPLTPYGIDKLASEMHARAASNILGVPTMGFRFFNVYGPRQDPSSPYSGVISIFTQRLLSGQNITINGDGQQTRDFVYVGDVVEHLIAGMMKASAKPKIFNVCTGTGRTINGLAAAIGTVLGRQPSIEFGPSRAGDIFHSVGDPQAAQRELGVRAQTTLEEGLKHTIAHLAPELMEVAA